MNNGDEIKMSINFINQYLFIENLSNGLFRKKILNFSRMDFNLKLYFCVGLFSEFD